MTASSEARQLRLLLSCACTLTRRAARSVNQLYDAVLAPIGIRASQFILLQTIADAGQVAQRDLAVALSASTETLSRRLATMRKHGWIELSIGSNQRERLYTITAAGREQLTRSLLCWRRAEERLKQQLGDQGWRQMLAMLDQLAVASEDAVSARSRNISE